MSRETQRPAIDKQEDHLSGEPELWDIKRDGTPSGPPIQRSGTSSPPQALVIKKDMIAHSRAFPHTFLEHDASSSCKKFIELLTIQEGPL
ncbi:hypothetical protein [Treponema sp. J25]|uniref:hypothetical protein n=1 Tax=Treponema sp. J25 TaxID=2094121 RepID=UPI0010450C0B|nr:hypothetical protein [Treponema sp. J25]TCW61834.1 hypothetical protein C5O22_03640 [Treponema sp. J25]